MMNSYKIFYTVVLLLLVIGVGSCKKFVEVEAPNTSINEGNVYQSNATAIAALTGIYTHMSRGNIFSGVSGMSLLAGLSADELTLAGSVTDQRLLAYYRNELRVGATENYGIDLWNGAGGLYNYIFLCNAAIEGLNQSGSLTPSVKNQLLGEAKFLRAFYYFYLANYYGDAVLALTTNPNVNAALPRATRQKVYEQVIADLKEAQGLLSTFFPDASLLKSTAERVRPTKWAATALLARTYLYLGQYANAEAEAGSIIGNTSVFLLSPLNGVFLKNSTEAIWQLQPIEINRNTEDAVTFVLPPSGPNASANPVYLSSRALASFEAGDLRRKGGNWVDSVIAGGTTYFYPAKYKAKTATGSFTEYQMMFRLAEQYLIRAEARTHQDNISGGQADLNMIRGRAGLANISTADKSALLNALYKERQVELFTEMGQRWLDLKRTGKVDEVMNVVTPLKGNAAGWKSYQQWYPIPFIDIQLNPKLTQNAGY